VIDNATTFRQLLGTNLTQLSFEERQAIAQCLISKIVVTGEEVDVHFVLPFDSPPQVSPRPRKEPKGAPGHFYRLRLADFQVPLVARPRPAASELMGIRLSEFPAPLPDRLVGDDDSTGEQQLFDIAVAEAEAVVQPDAVADDLGRKTVVFVQVGWCRSVHRSSHDSLLV
jgi:hypothetical protein